MTPWVAESHAVYAKPRATVEPKLVRKQCDDDRACAYCRQIACDPKCPVRPYRKYR